MMEKRGPHRADHLALLKTATEEGACLLGKLSDTAKGFHTFQPLKRHFELRVSHCLQYTATNRIALLKAVVFE